MAAVEPFQLTWSTDPFLQANVPNLIPATFGPDGPWQAVVVGVGNTSGELGVDGGRNGFYTVLYPSGADPTQLITPQAGGNYSVHNSSTAVLTDTSVGQSDSWFSTTIQNQTSSGTTVFDNIVLGDLIGAPIANGNATIAANSNWTIPLRNGQSYQNQVGILGLGTAAEEDELGSPAAEDPWLLDQIKQSGAISSNSFGLHIGSVSKNVTGSLILGGYDKSRVIGPVGSFFFEGGAPYAFLGDINAGVVTGGSPFPENQSQHLYTGNGGQDLAAGISAQLGATQGTTVVVPNPAYPYIALPPGNCESIVSRLDLPVTLDNSTGYYMWNQQDAKFATIVKSPAYLEFILSDSTATNISIKVPFALLNLTLEPPIVETPAPYFPCQSVYSPYGVWMLGRSFLQAAFLGVSYEQNVTWMAQAPGPSTPQRIAQYIQPSDSQISSSPASVFEQTWNDHWQVLSADGTSAGANSTSLTSTPPSSSGLSGGAIAGIVIAVVAAIAIAAAAFWFFRRRGRHHEPAAELMLPRSDSPDREPKYGSPQEIDGQVQSPPEMDGRHTVGPELAGHPPPELGGEHAHEVEGPAIRHELDAGY